jgi:hypothetical protein
MAANMGIRAIVPRDQRFGWNDNFNVTMEMTSTMTANAVTIFDFRRDRLNARIDTSRFYGPIRPPVKYRITEKKMFCDVVAATSNMLDAFQV